MPEFTVRFDRIGRNHNVKPLIVEARNADDLENKILRYARKWLVSRDVDIEFDPDKNNGFIVCGFHDGGSFTVESTMSQVMEKEFS